MKRDRGAKSIFPIISVFGDKSRKAVFAILFWTILFVAYKRVDAASGDCLWGGAGEKTTYLEPYFSYMAPNIPVLTRPIESESPAADGDGTTASDSTPLSAENSTKNVANGANIGAKLGESGTCVGTDGRVYRYMYVKGVRPRRVVESRWVYETPPGGGFPVWVEKKTTKERWEYVLIKQLSPIDPIDGSGPAPCRPNETIGTIESAETSETSPSYVGVAPNLSNGLERIEKTGKIGESVTIETFVRE